MNDFKPLIKNSKFVRLWASQILSQLTINIMAFMLFILTFILPEITSVFRIILGLVCVLLLGLSFVGILIPSQTFLQEKTPGGMRGRVFGNYWFLATVATVFPVIFSGVITEIFGIRLLLFILTGSTIATLLFSKKYGLSAIKGELNFHKNDK